jgi:hypothetical protein
VLFRQAEVRKVDLLSGRSTRAIGVKYRCTIPEGRRGSCIEEVVDYIPGRRIRIGSSSCICADRATAAPARTRSLKC